MPGREKGGLPRWAAPGTVSSPKKFPTVIEGRSVCMSSTRQSQTPSACIVPRGGDHCDFCSTPPVFKVYRCANFVAKGRPVFAKGVAAGSWAACRKCAELVDQGKWNDLTQRAVRKFVKRHRVARDEVAGVRAQLAEISRSFALNKIGTAHPAAKNVQDVQGI